MDQRARWRIQKANWREYNRADLTTGNDHVRGRLNEEARREREAKRLRRFATIKSIKDSGVIK